VQLSGLHAESISPPSTGSRNAFAAFVTTRATKRSNTRSWRLTADVLRLADESSTSVAAVCRVLQLPRSTFYSRRTRSMSARARDTQRLDVEVTAIHQQSTKRITRTFNFSLAPFGGDPARCRDH
jgi:hypothetical protein